MKKIFIIFSFLNTIFSNAELSINTIELKFDSNYEAKESRKYLKDKNYNVGVIIKTFIKQIDYYIYTFKVRFGKNIPKEKILKILDSIQYNQIDFFADNNYLFSLR